MPKTLNMKGSQGQSAELMMPPRRARGTYQEFLRALLSYESGIDPARLEEYKSGGTTMYVPVETSGGNPVPGTGQRDPVTGKFLAPVSMTWPQYFATLGLNFADATSSAEKIAEASYQAINFIGFVGFQLGEATLISTGYYKPATHAGMEGTLPAYYQWTGEDERFANGTRYSYYEIPGSETKIYTTSHNFWSGTFTGKHGLSSLDDLKNPAVAELVIRELMRFNIDTVEAQWRHKTGQDSVGKRIILEQILTRTVVNPSNPDESVIPTLSGLLAACHLRGAWGVSDILLGLIDDTGDETGTSVYDYCTRFNEFVTNFDNPGDGTPGSGDETMALSAQYAETITTGWGNDIVDIASATSPSAAKTIILHRSAMDSVRFSFPFRFGTDRIRLEGFESTGIGYDVSDKLEGFEVTADGAGSRVSFAYQDVFFVEAPDAIQIRLEEIFSISRALPLTWLAAPALVESFNVGRDVFVPGPGINGLQYTNLTIAWDRGRERVVIGVGTDSYQSGDWTVKYVLDNLSDIGDTSRFTEANFQRIEGSFRDLVNQRIKRSWPLGWETAEPQTIQFYNSSEYFSSAPGEAPISFSNLVLEYTMVNGTRRPTIGIGEQPGQSGPWKPLYILENREVINEVGYRNFQGILGSFDEIVREPGRRFDIETTPPGPGDVITGFDPAKDFVHPADGASIEFSQLVVRYLKDANEAIQIGYHANPSVGSWVRVYTLAGVTDPALLSSRNFRGMDGLYQDLVFEENPFHAYDLPWSVPEHPTPISNFILTADYFRPAQGVTGMAFSNLYLQYGHGQPVLLGVGGIGDYKTVYQLNNVTSGAALTAKNFRGFEGSFEDINRDTGISFELTFAPPPIPQTITNFNLAESYFEPAPSVSGMTFGNIHIASTSQKDTPLILGINGVENGEAYYVIANVTDPARLTAANFKELDGSFSDIVHVVREFHLLEETGAYATRLSTPIERLRFTTNSARSFSSVVLTHAEGFVTGDAVRRHFTAVGLRRQADPTSIEYERFILLAPEGIADLGEKNFIGFTGSFSEATVNQNFHRGHLGRTEAETYKVNFVDHNGQGYFGPNLNTSGLNYNQIRYNRPGSYHSELYVNNVLVAEHQGSQYQLSSRFSGFIGDFRQVQFTADPTFDGRTNTIAGGPILRRSTRGKQALTGSSTKRIAKKVVSSESPNAEGAFGTFLDALLTYESGIDPNFDYGDGTGSINYFRVLQDVEGKLLPGRPLRNFSSGEVEERVSMTYRNYFETLGLNFDQEGSTSPAKQQARYRSINFLGFVGYQVGEATLTATGYYIPEQHTETGIGTYPAYYFYDEDDSVFAFGNEYAYVEIDGLKRFRTPSNLWRGTFTGLDGLNSLDDLRNPAVQERVIRSQMRYNLEILENVYRERTGQQDVDKLLIFRQILNTIVRDQRPENPRPDILPTISGLLAATHLRGPWGVAGVLLGDEDGGDETGTSVYDYCEKFNGYGTIYDSPANDTLDANTLSSVAIPELITGGWAEDTVVSPANTTTKLIYPHYSAFGSLTLTVPSRPTPTVKIVLDDYPASADLGYDTDGNITGITVEDHPDGGSIARFAWQDVIFPDPKATIEARLNDIFVIARRHSLSWVPQGAPIPISGFRTAYDSFVPDTGVTGLGFGNLALYVSEGKSNVVLGVEADLGSGIVYLPYYELLGVTNVNQLGAWNFKGLGGSFFDIHLSETGVISEPIRTWLLSGGKR